MLTNVTKSSRRSQTLSRRRRKNRSVTVAAEVLEHRIVQDATLGGLIGAYNAGHEELVDAIRQTVNDEFGVDLPVVREAFAEQLDITAMVEGSFDEIPKHTSLQGIRDFWQSQKASGFTLNYVGLTPDSKGDLLRVTFERTVSGKALNFNVAGDTKFGYFDDGVSGNLGGGVQGQSPDVRIRITFGVDQLKGVPTFFVTDDSQISLTQSELQGNVSGDLTIRYLANVEANGRAKLSLDASGVTLVDSDADGKLRSADLHGSGVRGDFSGEVTLDTTFTTEIPVLDAIEWEGSWSAAFDNSGTTTSGGVTVQPSIETVTDAVVGGFRELAGNIDFFETLSPAEDHDIDFVDRSVGDLAENNANRSWLDKLATPNFHQVDGLTFPTITADKIRGLINGDRVDLISFQRQGSGTLFGPSSLEIATPPIPIGGILTGSAYASISGELGWQYQFGVGIDTTGVWIDPRTSLGLYGGIRAGVGVTVEAFGLVGLSFEAGAGAQVFAGVGLSDPDPSDGRIYLDEIWLGDDDGRSLATAITDVIDFDVRVDAEGYVKAELELPWPLSDITLVDESFSLGTVIRETQKARDQFEDSAGDLQSTLRKRAIGGFGTTAPPVRFRNGALILDGTPRDDTVSLSQNGNGDVIVNWAGFSEYIQPGVQRVEFSGHAGNDTLIASDAFSIPIHADGGSGHDYVVGGGGHDTLVGGSEADTLLGGRGNDSLSGSSGADYLSGESGEDTLGGGADNDILKGGSDKDTLYGGVGQDIVDGGIGSDHLEGGAESDVLYGRSGDDTLVGDAGNDSLFGGDNDDTLQGGDGKDVLKGGLGSDTIEGGDHSDLIFGDPAQNQGQRDDIYGGDGDDTILSGGGDDYVNGGRGNDLIHGGDADDTLIGSLDEDSVSDDKDLDTILGGSGDDVLRGGRGADVLNGQDGVDEVYGEAGDDRLVLDLSQTQQSDADILFGGTDQDTLWIAPKFDAGIVHNSVRGPEDVVWQGDATTGDNHIVLEQTGTSVFIARDKSTTGSASFTLSSGPDSDLETITIAGLDGDDHLEVKNNTSRNIILDGGDGNDTLIGGSGRDLLRGMAGDDSLVGNGNNDELHGGAGLDTLYGNQGSDRLYGGPGDDTLKGGAEFDIQYGGEGNDYIESGAGSEGDLIYGDDTSAQRHHDHSYDDTIAGGDGRDTVFAGPGKDLVVGGKLSDLLFGGTGDDTIRGGSGADFIFGNEGRDELHAFTDDPTAIDELQQMDFPRVRRELNTKREAILQEYESAEAELYGLDLLDGEEDQELSTINEAGINHVQRKLDDEIAYWKSKTGPDREFARMRISHWDGLDGVVANDPANATIDAKAILDAGVLRQRLEELIPIARELYHAYELSHERIGAIPSPFQTLRTDLIDGGDDDDFIYGSAFPDKLVGGSDNDIFFLSGGDDTLSGNDGIDTLMFLGTEQNDVISIEAISIEATPGESSNVEFLISLNGSAEHRLELEWDIESIGVLGLGGNDKLSAELGRNALANVVFDGGNGRDTISVGRDRYLYGPDGQVLEAKDGNPIESQATLIGGAGNDTITGGDSDDHIDGGSGNDLLRGGAGRDVISGGTDHDTIYGGSENDTIRGGTGNDTLYGESGNDRMLGEDGWNRDGGGNDYIDGGRHTDHIWGDSGNDTLLGGAGDEPDYLYGGKNDDSLVGGGGNDGLNGGEGHDYLHGEGGSDTLKGMFGNDVLLGGPGNDRLTGDDGTDNPAGGRDYLRGGDDHDFLEGDGGNDLLFGDGGRDSLYGDAGDDVVEEHDRDSIVNAGPGWNAVNDLSSLVLLDAIDGGKVWVTLHKDNRNSWGRVNGTRVWHRTEAIEQATDGSLWVLRKANQRYEGLWRLDIGQGASYSSIVNRNWELKGSDFSRLEKDRNGDLFSLRRNGSLYRWSDNALRRIGDGHTHLIKYSGHVYSLGTDRVFYYWKGDTWRRANFGQKQIEVSEQGDIFLLNTKGRLYRWSDTRWSRLPSWYSSIWKDRSGAMFGRETNGRVRRIA